MVTLVISVEGITEERFAKIVLTPHLATFGKKVSGKRSERLR